jgi:hypothetical protein
MTNLVEKVVAEVEKYVPGIPIIQLVQAIIATIENPIEQAILADIQIIMMIYVEMKAKLNGVHPNLVGILKALI